MQRSEQIDTCIWLALNSQSLGEFLLQRMPDAGGGSQYDPKMMTEGWERIQMLGSTITNEELLEVAPKTLLRPLFLEESERFGVRSFPIRLIHFVCRCSRKRVSGCDSDARSIRGG